MEVIKVIIYKTSDGHYYLRSISSNKTKALDAERLSSDDKKQLLEFFKDKKIDGYTISYFINETEGELFDILKDFVEEYNKSLDEVDEISKWRQYDNKKIILVDDEEYIKKLFELNNLKKVSEITDKDKLNKNYFISLIEEDINESKRHKNIFSLFYCPNCKSNVIVKKDDRICPHCKSPLDSEKKIKDGEYNELEALIQTSFEGKSVNNYFLLKYRGIRFNAKEEADVIKFNNSIYRNSDVGFIMFIDEMGLIHFKKEYIDFMKVALDIELDHEFYLTHKDLYSNFFDYFINLKNRYLPLIDDVTVFLPFKDGRIKNVKEYLQTLLMANVEERNPLLHYYFDYDYSFYFDNFFRIANENISQTAESLSFLFYSILDEFIYVSDFDNNLKKYPRNILKNLTETTEIIGDTYELRSNLIRQITSFKNITDELPDEIKNVIKCYMEYIPEMENDYDLFVYIDYCMSGKKIFKYKRLKLYLPYENPEAIQLELYGFISQQYFTYKTEEKLNDFFEIVGSSILKTILNNFKELDKKIMDIKYDRGGLLDYYLALNKRVNLSTTEFVINDIKGKIPEIALKCVEKDISTTQKFIESKDLEKILRFVFKDNYEITLMKIEENFNQIKKEINYEL